MDLTSGERRTKRTVERRKKTTADLAGEEGLSVSPRLAAVQPGSSGAFSGYPTGAVVDGQGSVSRASCHAAKEEAR